MSRLQTFLTYKDYDEFKSTAHCSASSQCELSISETWVQSYCTAWSTGKSFPGCTSCILDSNHAFKTEALLTEKET